jgi:hypothetical protein
MGLLESESSSAIQPDDRMIASFTEIGSFIDTYHREPSEEGDMSEYQLANRLKAFREDSEKVKILQPFDTHHLLPPLTHQVTNIADIFADDELGLLQEDADIFTLKYVKHSSERAETDYIARRKPCLDFEEYRA